MDRAHAIQSAVKKRAVKHVGFKGAEDIVEKRQGYSKEVAAKIIGAASHNASAAARRNNPRLARVK